MIVTQMFRSQYKIRLDCGCDLYVEPSTFNSIRIGDEIFCPTHKEAVDKHTFTSGASSSGYKLPYETLTPIFLKRAAARMALGLPHYGKHNWKKGVSDKNFILDRLNHAFEHLIKVMYEIDNGITMTDDDLAAVVVNCMFAMEYQETFKLDNPDEKVAEAYRQVFGLPSPISDSQL